MINIESGTKSDDKPEANMCDVWNMKLLRLCHGFVELREICEYCNMGCAVSASRYEIVTPNIFGAVSTTLPRGEMLVKRSVFISQSDGK